MPIQNISNRTTPSTPESSLAWEMSELAQGESAWEEMYGSVESNLSNYYSTVTPELLATTGLNERAREHTQQVQRMRTRFAQQNIDSPAQAMLEQQEDIRFAEAKAETRQEAKQEAVEGQQDFLTFGMNLARGKDALKSGVRAASANLQTAQANQQQRDLQQQQLDEQRRQFDIQQQNRQGTTSTEINPFDPTTSTL